MQQFLKKSEHNTGDLSLFLIFLIWGLILNHGRRANSWISTSHSSIVQLVTHFRLNHTGSEKGGGKEFAAFSHNMPIGEVVTPNPISQIRNLSL